LTLKVLLVKVVKKIKEKEKIFQSKSL